MKTKLFFAMAVAFLGWVAFFVPPSYSGDAALSKAQYRIGDRLGSSRPGDTRAPATYREANWDELVPKDWDPAKDLRALNLDTLADGDRRAIAAMEKLRELWDNAPVNPVLQGATLKLPGFIVPLEEGKDGLKEFLLVPYFGACIHVPPPPANQIVHVFAPKGIKGVKTMDAVWVSGTLSTERGQTQMGASGYRMEVASVEPYREKPARR